MTTPPRCSLCDAPAVDAPGKPLCVTHAAMAREIANQQIDAAITAIRTLKAEHKDQEAA